MHVDVVWLTAALLSFPLLTLCDPLYIMSTSQILKVGTSEQVLVEVQDYTGTDELTVDIRIMDFPKKELDLASYSTKLNTGNKYLALVNIEVPFGSQGLDVDSDKQQFVYLKAIWSNRNELEKIVMVSFQSGYIYVFTDKTIYTPDTDVKYRLFVLNPNALPGSKSVSVNIVTPEDVIVDNTQVNVNLGVASGVYKLKSPIRNGFWKIAATFTDYPQKNFTAEFEVKEYRLPSFNIELDPLQPFYYIEDNEDFKVDIRARYLFGENVEGSAFVVFGVLIDKEKKNIRSSLQRVPMRSGEGEAVLKKQDLIQTFPNIHDLVDKTLYISVSVLTDTGSEMVEAERRGIHIVTSPYTIHFTKTSKYFKPGMPFNFMVYVTNPDGTPAEKIELLAESYKEHPQVISRTETNGVASFTINTGEQMSDFSITVKTNVTMLKPERQAKKMLEVKPYRSGSKSFLNINMPSGEKIVGSQVRFEISMKDESSADHEITYMVLSKGQILKPTKLKRAGSYIMAENLLITYDMLPSFRIVAYYHVGSVVVSDSVWVDVKDTCMGKLDVRTKDVHSAYIPTTPVELQLTGDPGAKVYLVAVDKGVYVLNNKNRLTQKKIWDVIESHDVGCTFGGGKDNMGVFYDAGLMFTTSSAGHTAVRDVASCQRDLRRKKRSVSKVQIMNTLLQKYSESLKKCCRDGLVKNLLSYTCERRSKYITDGDLCRKAFLDCCTKLTDVEQETVQEELQYARTEEEDVNLMSDGITSRSYFPESWMWDIVELPSTASVDEQSSVKIKEDTLPDSITTWVINAISMSQNKGICVAEPYEVTVKKDFFIDLKLPYSAVVSEQIEIKAIIHNLGNMRLDKVYVDLLETEHVCSKASNKDKKYRTTVKVDPRSSRAVSFIVIPLKAKIFNIEVKAVSLQPLVGDGVKKKLKVVPPGLLTSVGDITIILEPENHRGEQRSEIKRPELENQVPGTDAHTFITVRGTPMAQMINEAISGQGLDDFIRQPYGCSEQNLLTMVLPLIATQYLDKTNQWQDIGVDKRTEALQHIHTGYTTELTYHRPDGGFAVFASSKSNTWLTAYVVKIFSKASNLLSMSPKQTCDSVKWLILQTKNPDGSFVEVGDKVSYHAEAKSSSFSLTAFVLIALQEASELCSDSVRSLLNSMEQSRNYLSRNIASINEPFGVTMASYALAKYGIFNRDILFKYASADKTHWPVYSSRENNQLSKSLTLEATGFALLTLLTVNDFEAAKPIVSWLKTQRNYMGSYYSTQATAVVFEAIAKYMEEKPPVTDVQMLVNVVSSTRTTPFNGLFTKNTRGLQRSDKFKNSGDLTVTAKGKGEGSISIQTLYYAKLDQNTTKCNNFELELKMSRDRDVSSMGAKATYTLSIKTRYLKDEPAPMTILDIGMLTGFEVETTDLDNLMRFVDRYIEKYEKKNTTFSERGSLIIYLSKVSNTDLDEIVFRMHQTSSVGHPQPAAITVYEYYNKENRCVKFYDNQMDRTHGSINIVCPEEVCLCAEANCAEQKWPDVPEEHERNKEACTNKDYAYKGTLQGISSSGSTITFRFTITEVLNAGTDTVEINDDRDFVAHSRCRSKLNLLKNKSYLIMGSQPVTFKKGYRYLFDSDTWIEYWPTQHESQENKNKDRERYIGLKDLADTLENSGCGT